MITNIDVILSIENIYLNLFKIAHNLYIKKYRIILIY